MWIDTRGVWPILVMSGGQWALVLRGAPKNVTVSEALGALEGGWL